MVTRYVVVAGLMLSAGCATGGVIQAPMDRKLAVVKRTKTGGVIALRNAAGGPISLDIAVKQAKREMSEHCVGPFEIVA